MNEIVIPVHDEDDIYTNIMKTNINERKLIINQEITDDLLEYVCMMILHWNAEDKNLPKEKRTPIRLYINTDGGDVVLGNNIVDVCMASTTPIYTIGMAKCASMGSYLLTVGDVRYAFPNTVVLLHDGQTGYVSSSNKGKDIQKFYDTLEKRGTEFMIAHTKMDAEFLESIKDREYYVYANEAKELGIIDKIIGVDCTIDEVI